MEGGSFQIKGAEHVGDGDKRPWTRKTIMKATILLDYMTSGIYVLIWMAFHSTIV